MRFVMTDRERYDPTHAAVAALLEARRQSGERWVWNVPHFDRLAGTDRLRRMIDEGRALAEITEPWEVQLEAFRRWREPQLLYR